MRQGKRWAALLAMAAISCAPQATPVTGPISDAVKASLATGTGTFDHETWGRLLAGGTHEGLVDYPYFQAHRSDLDGYLDAVAEVDLGALAADELKALMFNAYNALTVRSILNHPEVGTIRDIPGVWKTARHRVGGYELTLDEIEHRILRPFFRDPRIHFALNCASMSCAPLRPWAFQGAGLDEQLDEVERAFLADRRNVFVEDGVLYLSKYFDWYGSDFTEEGWRGAQPSAASYVARAARPDVAAFLMENTLPPVSYLEYDWSLNAAVPPDPAVRPAGDTDGGSGGWVSQLRSWVEGYGPLGPAVYAAAYVVATVAFVPGSALTIGAGVAFGVVVGTLVVSVGSTLGAALSFLLARTLLRSRVERWVAGNEKFAAIDRAVAREGWKIVALTRLSPVFPFNLLNYSYGLTGVRFWPYVLTSWVAMLPGTVLFVYLGAAGAQVADSVTGAGSWARTVLQVVGLMATLAVTVLITRVARRALREGSGAEGAPASG
jgi:uncharacterized membrane protein YdjX (TVP38/TMEM64 family)